MFLQEVEKLWDLCIRIDKFSRKHVKLKDSIYWIYKKKAEPRNKLYQNVTRVREQTFFG